MELLLKHGARIDVEARMCWPGPHNQNCEQRGRYSSPFEPGGADQRSSDRLQSAVYYAIDGDQVSPEGWLEGRGAGGVGRASGGYGLVVWCDACLGV